MVEVPPYHSKTVGSAVQVQFYVCNGKRKRSQSQRFTYLSGEMRGFHLKGIVDYTLMCFFYLQLPCLDSFENKTSRIKTHRFANLKLLGTSSFSATHFTDIYTKRFSQALLLRSFGCIASCCS